MTLPSDMRIYIGAVVLIGIAVLIYLSMGGKLPSLPNVESAGHEMVIEPLVPGVRLRWSDSDRIGTIIYEDGVAMPRDGLSVYVVTADDFRKSPEKYADYKLTEDKFPAVFFGNASGFDGVGLPAVVRSAKDGKLLWSRPNAPAAMAMVVIPQRDGTYHVVSAKGKVARVEAGRWIEAYLGYKEVPPDAKAAPIVKGGIEGKVVQAIGAAKVPLTVPLHLFLGPTKAFDVPDKTHKQLVVTVMTDANGSYKVELPSGSYAVVLEIGGKMEAPKDAEGLWTSTVTVKDGVWTKWNIARQDKK